MGVGYDLDYHFRIKELTAATNTDYQKYDGGATSTSSGPKIMAEYDSRRNAINPRGGFYASVIYTYYYRGLGSDNNYNSLKGDFRFYVPLSKNRKHILALWNYDWFTFNGHAPYLDLPATAWDDYNATGRGYVQSRFRGKNMLDLEAEYRFPILRDGFFGGVVFANVESFTDYPSTKFTTAAPGWGLGLRVKLNKNSDTNICFDYGFGLHRSNDFIINVGELF
jgi:outer membrane protein assembly factor BamA